MASPLEIAQKLEAAVKVLEGKKSAYDSAVRAVGDAEVAYRAAHAAVQELHQAYSELMSKLIVGFGQVHK